MQSVYFVSLGCPKNLVDSEVMLGKLQNDSYRLVDDPANAETIIVNTCSFIQAAKEESINTILEMADQKETGNCNTLVVSGCLPQRYSEELEKELPEIDVLIGTGQYHKITEALEQRRKERKLGKLPPRKYIDQPAFIHSESDARVHTGASHSAYLKLSEGCNRRCAFCIIPTLRGNVRSRSEGSLVQEATTMAAQGVKELNLVAQDLTHYGIENRYEFRLETLLPKLCRVDGIEWIRLHYVYPDQFTDKLIEVIANEEKIVNYLDMPIQHTNNRVLKSMNRSLTKERLFKLIQDLRSRIPDISFRTSIIVGFPGETEKEFDELCSDLIELDLDNVGVFSFSREEGTKADQMLGHLPASVKKRREKKLVRLLSEKAEERFQRMVGKNYSAIVEGPSEETELLLQGRLSTQAQGIDGHVLINDIEGDFVPKPGQIVGFTPTELLGKQLVGRAFLRTAH